MATEPIKGFKPAMIHLGKDGDIVKGPKQAEAIIPGLIRKNSLAKPEASEGKMASHINGMKRRGTIRSTATPRGTKRNVEKDVVIRTAPPGATGKQSITSKSSASPMDALPGYRKPKMARDMPRNKGA